MAKRDRSEYARQVDDVFQIVKVLLEPVELAHRDPASGPVLIDLAFRRIDEWAVLADPKLHLREGGGSTPSNEAADEQTERALTARMALRARDDLPEALAAWLVQGRRILDDVRRFTRTVDASKLPKDDREQFCVNCRKAGFPWAVVYDKAIASGLCRWCWERRGAVADDDQPPPVEVVKLHHQGRHRDAARELARLRSVHLAKQSAA